MLEARIPAGHHVIELHYWPRPLHVGLFVAGICALHFAYYFMISWGNPSKEFSERFVALRSEYPLNGPFDLRRPHWWQNDSGRGRAFHAQDADQHEVRDQNARRGEDRRRGAIPQVRGRGEYRSRRSKAATGCRGDAGRCILLVLFSRFWIPGIYGGGIGVEVFLVISGT